ncbi:hypothetical protein LNN38_12875 [Pseudomonas sp. LA21]|uniref:hypothetical protein n=1 Tax=unclassified Pseudomonas TaxID=196821 RepID=UPI001A9DDEA6|nr:MULTISPECIES: hypothetical protein [unclassified Pseudomonas]MCJ1885742.1 hypothetical protein [Pseudomonas sp. LA21]
MLDIVPHENTYLIEHLEEIEAVVIELSFNVQDDHWMVYTQACGHEHLDLPEQHERAPFCDVDPYRQAA